MVLSEGAAVVSIGQTVVNGTVWKEVRTPKGTQGWMSADLLVSKATREDDDVHRG